MPKMINRRDALIQGAQILGYSLSAGAAMSVLEGCQRGSGTYQTLFFDRQVYSVIGKLVDRILPATEIPGGLEVSVDQFVDLMLALASPHSEQEKFRAGYQILEAVSREKFGRKAVKCNDDQLEQLLKEVAGLPADHAGQFFFRKLKGLALLGYFTSEKIGTEVLNYDPVPGEFRGCIPLAEVGKSWTI
jgi:hypothetical protein